MGDGGEGVGGCEGGGESNGKKGSWRTRRLLVEMMVVAVASDE